MIDIQSEVGRMRHYINSLLVAVYFIAINFFYADAFRDYSSKSFMVSGIDMMLTAIVVSFIGSLLFNFTEWLTVFKSKPVRIRFPYLITSSLFLILAFLRFWNQTILATIQTPIAFALPVILEIFFPFISGCLLIKAFQKG